MIQLLKLTAALLTLYHFLGPWGSLVLVGAIVALGAAFYAFGDRIFERIISGQVSGLGRVMKDASVTIHSIARAEEPDPSVWRTGDDDEDDEDDAFEHDLEQSGMPEGEYDWYAIDATITPRPAADGTPAGWDPAMLQLVKDDGRSREPLELDLDCLKAQVELWEDGGFVPFEYGTVPGAARVKILVGVTPGTADVRLRYFGEDLAQLRLPSRLRVSA